MLAQLEPQAALSVAPHGRETIDIERFGVEAIGATQQLPTIASFVWVSINVPALEFGLWSAFAFDAKPANKNTDANTYVPMLCQLCVVWWHRTLDSNLFSHL